jgi:hypothetical protein
VVGSTCSGGVESLLPALFLGCTRRSSSRSSGGTRVLLSRSLLVFLRPCSTTPSLLKAHKQMPQASSRLHAHTLVHTSFRKHVGTGSIARQSSLEGELIVPEAGQRVLHFLERLGQLLLLPLCKPR